MVAAKAGVVYEVLYNGVDLRSGQRVNNVVHVRQRPQATPPDYGEEITGSDLNDLAQSMRNTFEARFLSQVSEHYRLEDVTIKEVVGWVTGVSGKILQYGGQGLSLAGGPTDQGSVEGEALPPFCSISIQKKSAYAGKSFRGSMRVGIIAEDDQSNGALTSTRQGAAQTAATAWLTTAFLSGAAGVTREFVLVLMSRETLFGLTMPLTGSLAFAVDVIALKVHGNIGSQVTRKPKSGDIINQDA